MARRRNVHLHQRDLEILEALLARRADTLEQLASRHFPDNVVARARNRLGELASAGYLTRISITTGGRRSSVYILGPRAKTALQLRSLAGDQLQNRRFNPVLSETSIPHQLAINSVGDTLGVQLTPEHMLTSAGPHRHRPDAAYRAARPDDAGRDLILVEVDLGHYSRQRILGKLQAFLNSSDARAILFVTPTDERAALVAHLLRAAERDVDPGRLQVLSLDELRAGSMLDSAFAPARSLD